MRSASLSLLSIERRLPSPHYLLPTSHTTRSQQTKSSKDSSLHASKANECQCLHSSTTTELDKVYGKDSKANALALETQTLERSVRVLLKLNNTEHKGCKY